MSDKILKLDQAQTLYQDLRERIDVLPTNEDITVTDVQVNGTSILTDGVANVPLGTSKGLQFVGGVLQTEPAGPATVKSGANTRQPIVPYYQANSTFYGLAKAAGIDMASSNNSVGTYTDEAKSAIRSMLGVQNFDPQSIAIVANGDTHAAITSGQYVYVQNHSTLTEGLYAASSAIAANETLSASNLTAVGNGGLNALLGKIPEQLIYLGKETDYPLSAAHTEYPIGITLMYTLASTSYPYGTGTVITIRSAVARCVQLNFSNSPDDYKLRTADSNGWSNWKSLKDVPGITDLQKAIGIVVDGNKAATAVTLGQFVILKNTTISGKADGLYTAAKAIPANTAIDGTYLTAVSGGGLNALNGKLSLLEISSGTVTEVQSLTTSGTYFNYTVPTSGWYTVRATTGNTSGSGFARIVVGNTIIMHVSASLGQYDLLLPAPLFLKEGTAIKAMAGFPENGGGSILKIA